MHHVQHRNKKKKRLSLFLPLLSRSNHHFLNLTRAEYCIKRVCVGEEKNYIDFKIPWFCYSAMQSNDQLFGLSLTLLRSPSSPNSNMKSTLTIQIHQRESIDLILGCSTPALLYLCINAVNIHQTGGG